MNDIYHKFNIIILYCLDNNKKSLYQNRVCYLALGYKGHIRPEWQLNDYGTKY